MEGWEVWQGARGLSMIFTDFYSHTCFDIWEFAEGDFLKQRLMEMMDKMTLKTKAP